MKALQLRQADIGKKFQGVIDATGLEVKFPEDFGDYFWTSSLFESSIKQRDSSRGSGAGCSHTQKGIAQALEQKAAI